MAKSLFAVALFVVILGAVQAMPWVAVSRADSHFTERHLSLLRVTKAHTGEEEIIFLGDSAMENWMFNGREIWGNFYMVRHGYNYGVAGDRVENVLWRIENGELDNVKAKVVVLLVGSNNRQDKPADIVKGLHAVNEALQKKVPNVKVLLLSILPRGEDINQVHETNKLLAAEDNQKTVFFLDLASSYEYSLGFINQTLFVEDKLNLSKKGYQIWYDKMEPTLARLLKL